MVLSETLARCANAGASPRWARSSSGVNVTLFSSEDLHLFNEGRHFRLHHHLVVTR